MNNETLKQGNALYWRIDGLKKFFTEHNTIQVRIETNHYCPDSVTDMITPETREAIDAKVAEIKDMIFNDLCTQIEALEAEFDAL